jgi:hypothetical protein
VTLKVGKNITKYNKLSIGIKGPNIAKGILKIKINKYQYQNSDLKALPENVK